MKIMTDHLRNEALFNMEMECGLPLRLAYIGLYAIGRRGQFPWKPCLLKLALLPYDKVDFELILQALAALGLIRRDGKWGHIVVPTTNR